MVPFDIGVNYLIYIIKIPDFSKVASETSTPAGCGDDTVVERLEILEAHQYAVERQVAELNEHLVRIGNKTAHYRKLYQRPLAWHTQATAVQISH